MVDANRNRALAGRLVLHDRDYLARSYRSVKLAGLQHLTDLSVQNVKYVRSPRVRARCDSILYLAALEQNPVHVALLILTGGSGVSPLFNEKQTLLPRRRHAVSRKEPEPSLETQRHDD